MGDISYNWWQSTRVFGHYVDTECWVEGGKAGGIPALEKGGGVGRGGGNIITTVSLHHIGEKEKHNTYIYVL